MDSAQAAVVVRGLAVAAGDGVLLWRGERLDGGDVDVVALDGHGADVAAALRRHGLTPAPQEPGRVLWRALPGEAVVVDVLDASSWPAMFPRLDGVVRRAAPGATGPLVAGIADRRLIHAAELLAGRPLRAIRSKLAPLTPRDERRRADATRGDAVDPIVRDERRVAALARVARAPEALRPGRRDVLRLRTALRFGVASSAGRRALRVRFAGDPLPPRVPGRGRLICLSGMDGAGKSTAALALKDGLATADRPAVVYWIRLAGDLRALDRVARVVKAAIRRRATADRPRIDGGDVTGRRGRIQRVWVALIALDAVRGARRASRLRRRGLTVVCDRWLADAVVDLRVRYGEGHGVAEWLLRRGFPTPDLAVLLCVDPAVAAARKPGDQPLRALTTMAGHYREAGAGLASIETRDGPEQTLRALQALI